MALVKQAGKLPTRKLSAATVTAAVMAFAGLILKNFAPGWYDPEAMLAFTPIAALMIGYFVRDQDNTP